MEQATQAANGWGRAFLPTPLIGSWIFLWKSQSQSCWLLFLNLNFGLKDFYPKVNQVPLLMI